MWSSLEDKGKIRGNFKGETMNYREMNMVENGQKVVCTQDHLLFKKGDIGTITFEYFGKGLYYKYVNLNDGRTDVLDATYKYWDVM